ncbi:MAG: SAM-dependent methyltransferase [Trebonia sp.]
MSGSSEWAGILPEREVPKIDITVAHPARIYDYWLGGKNNFAADREAAEATLAGNPYILPGVRANRAFLAAAVRYLAAEAGVRQFLDVGTGLPTENSTHEVAQAVAPDSRVVYVDNDPIVISHARALLTGKPGTTDCFQADLRDPDAIVRGAARTLDFGEPVAVLLLMVLMHVFDDDRPHELVARLIDAVPPGSYLVISETANDVDAEVIAASQEQYNQRVRQTQWASRTRQTFASYFSGLELAEPGVVTLGRWRPAPGAAVPPRPIPAYCAVARKPAAG